MTPAPFDVHSEMLEDGIRAIVVTGELDLNTAPDLERPLQDAILDERASVVIDLSDCEFIDSTGIAVIVRAWQQLDGRGEKSGRLVLCCSNDQVQRLLEITGVESSISVHRDLDSAVSELRD